MRRFHGVEIVYIEIDNIQKNVLFIVTLTYCYDLRRTMLPNELIGVLEVTVMYVGIYIKLINNYYCIFVASAKPMF